MKKIIMILTVIVISLNCDNNNPVSQNPNPIDTTQNVVWPTLKFVRSDTAYSLDETYKYSIVISNKSLIDSIKIKDSTKYFNGQTYVSPGFGKEQLNDTITIISGIGGDNDINYNIIRMYKGNKYKDTIDSIISVDNIEVEVKKGSFYPQYVKIGDTVLLYVVVKSNITPYTCQWYLNGSKIGDNFTKTSSDSIYINRKINSINDTGYYSIALDKPNAKVTATGMHVLLSN